MANQNVDDGFVLVNPRKAARRKRNKNVDLEQVATVADVLATDKVVEQLAKIKEELLNSSFFKGVSESFAQTKSETGLEINRIVCYGIGSIASSVIARYQFSLLILLRDMLHISKSKCEVYDPILTDNEMEIIENAGFVILKVNEEGKRAVTEPTLFYLPHCGKALYNNLLWANWCPQKLLNCFIFGNSFTSINERTPSRILNKQAGLVKKMIPYTKEIPINNTFKFTDVFNDTSLHVFMQCMLGSVDPDFWIPPPEPVYDVDDLEIVLNNVKI